MLCDSSDTNAALGMCFKCILFMIIQDMLLASALLVLQWTSHFFEVVIVALVKWISFPPKKKKKKKKVSMQKPDTKKRPTPARQRWTAQRHLCASYKDQKQAAIVTPNPCLAQQAESVSSNERGSSTTPGRTNVVECLLQGLQPSHTGVPAPQPAWAYPRDLPYIIIAFYPIMANHGSDRLQGQSAC